MSDVGQQRDLPPLPSDGGPLMDNFRRGMRRVKRFFIGVLIVLGALTFLAALTWVFLEIQGRRRLSAALEYAESLGIPRTRPAPAAESPSAAEATRVFEEATRLSRVGELRTAVKALPGTTIPESAGSQQGTYSEATAHAVRIIDSYGEVFRLAHKAAEAARSERIDLAFGYSGSVTTAIYALTGAACAKAVGGDPDGAVEFIEDGLALLATDDSKGGKDRLSSRRTAWTWSLSPALSYILQSSAPSTGALERLGRELVRTANGLPAESAALDAYYRQIEEYGSILGEPLDFFEPETFLEAAALHVGMFLAHGVMKMDEASFIRTAAPLVAGAANPTPGQLITAASCCEGLSPFWSMAGSAEAWRICEALVVSAATRAEMVSAAVAVAAARYRADNGEWPGYIDVLVPKYLDAMPTDPFSGAPLVYRVTGAGVMVYSVGPNGTDDGGLALYGGSVSGLRRRQRVWGQSIGASDEVGFVIWEEEAAEE